MNPLLGTFIRLTLAIVAVVVAFFILAFVLKVVVFAAIIAALVVGGLFVYNFFRRQRSRLPVIR